MAGEDRLKAEAPFATDNSDDARLGSTEELKEGVGALNFEQYTAGGLGRHLGVFSTTSLMYALLIDITQIDTYLTVFAIVSVALLEPASSLRHRQSSMALVAWARQCSFGCWVSS